MLKGMKILLYTHLLNIQTHTFVLSPALCFILQMNFMQVLAVTQLSSFKSLLKILIFHDAYKHRIQKRRWKGPQEVISPSAQDRIKLFLKTAAVSTVTEGLPVSK